RLATDKRDLSDLSIMAQRPLHEDSLYDVQRLPSAYSTVFPYTTLFRSDPQRPDQGHLRRRSHRPVHRRGQRPEQRHRRRPRDQRDRKSTRLNSSHVKISYAVLCLKKKTKSARSDPSCMNKILSVNSIHF